VPLKSKCALEVARNAECFKNSINDVIADRCVVILVPRTASLSIEQDRASVGNEADRCLEESGKIRDATGGEPRPLAVGVLAKHEIQRKARMSFDSGARSPFREVGFKH
jgi:hypothetical protein